MVQASAADWAAVWLSRARQELIDLPVELVFFQHDELVVHAPAELAEGVAAVTVRAAEAARDLVFPETSATTPVRPVIVQCYADAK